MSADIQFRLQTFARELLEWRGGAVEWPDGSETGEALLPRDVAAVLNCPEATALGRRPDNGRLAVDLATDFLERAAPLFEDQPWIGAFEVPGLYLKKSEMGSVIARAFTWQNARVKYLGTSAQHVGYDTWYFHALIQSDDSWEDIIHVTINPQSQARVALPEFLPRDDLRPLSADTPPAVDTLTQAVKHATQQIDLASKPFVVRAEGRFSRDRRRITEYYAALLRETKARIEKAKSGEETQKQNNLAEAVTLERKRRLLDLEDRYALRRELRPFLLLRVVLPVLATEYEFTRKQARRIHTVFWNPILKDLEPLACHACGRGIFSVFFTDDVRPTCVACTRK